MHGSCMRKTYIFLLLTVLMLPSLGLSRSVTKMFNFFKFGLIILHVMGVSIKMDWGA